MEALQQDEDNESNKMDSRFVREPGDAVDELEVVPLLESPIHDSAADDDKSVHQQSLDFETNGQVSTSNSLSEDSCQNAAALSFEEVNPSKDKMNQTDSGTYEFRNNYEVVKLAESNGMDEHLEVEGERNDNENDNEARSNNAQDNECEHFQTCEDYNFLVQSLDASMSSYFLNTYNLTFSTCEDAISKIAMKRSTCEPIDLLNYFEYMPIELIVHIFSYLSTIELCRHVIPVCNQWRRLAMDQTLWKCIDFTALKHLDSLNLLWAVRRAPQLKKLVIRGRANVSMAEIAIITEFCPCIQDINLGFCDSLNCDMLLCLFKNCPKLRRINVEGCEKIDSKCIRLMSRCKKLTHLNLSHCRLPDPTLKYLCENLKKLISINLDGISFTTDRVVVAMVSKHSEWLQEVELDGLEISDESLMHLSKCSQLKHFSMSFCECLTDQGLVYLKNLKNLQVLRLRKGLDFSVEGLISFFKEAHLSKLHSLNLSECSEINDQVVLEMVKACGKNLKELALSWCWFITEKGLISILDHCCNLRLLNLLGINKITGECLTRVPEEMEFLQFLDLQQCNGIVDSLIYDVVRMKPDLHVLNYYGEMFVHCADSQ